MNIQPRLTEKQMEMRKYYIENKTKDSVFYEIFYDRVIRNGESYEEAIVKRKKKSRKTSSRELKYSQKFYFYLRIAESNGINYHAYYNRIKTGWDYQKASIVPLRKANITPEEYSIAASNGISKKIVQTRVRNGFSVKRAITEPVRYAHLRKEEKTIDYSTMSDSNKEEEKKRKALRQIRWYIDKGLPIPRKYIQYIEKYNLQSELR